MSDHGRVLVTGAAGFVGSAIVRALLAGGYEVRALVRATSPRENLAGLDIETIEGSIEDAQAMAKAMAGMRFVVHAAAAYSLWSRDTETIMRANVTGTRIVMEASLDAGVERIVHTSSVATLALPTNGGVGDESMPLAESAAIGAYKRSKVIAERLVEAMIARDALPAVIVNPSTPVGPRDARPTPTGRIIVEAASGRMPGFVDTGLNLVHVDDVAAGHVAALERGRVGERYIVGGDNVPLADMLREIALLVGRAPPRWKIPRAPLYPLAVAAEMMAFASGRAPFLTVDGLRMSRHHMYFTSAKAQRELDYHARPYREGLRAAVDWFRAAGRVR